MSEEKYVWARKSQNLGLNHHQKHEIVEVICRGLEGYHIKSSFWFTFNQNKLSWPDWKKLSNLQSEDDKSQEDLRASPACTGKSPRTFPPRGNKWVKMRATALFCLWYIDRVSVSSRLNNAGSFPEAPSDCQSRWQIRPRRIKTGNAWISPPPPAMSATSTAIQRERVLDVYECSDSAQILQLSMRSSHSGRRLRRRWKRRNDAVLIPLMAPHSPFLLHWEAHSG